MSTEVNYKITALAGSDHCVENTLFKALMMFFSLMSGCVLLLVLTALSPAVDANSTKGTPAPIATASNCHNVYNYNSFSAGPNKEIKTLLLEMKMQLAGLQKTAEGIKGNKTIVKGDVLTQ